MMSADSRRVLFVDLARAAAVLFMIQGHSLAVLLAPEYQHSEVFGAWLFLRGLTSCTFLTLSGFSFAIASERHWNDYLAPSSRLRRRFVRFGSYLLIGYAMRIPIRPLSDIGRVTASQWQAFAVVDILQLVAVTLAALQLMLWMGRTVRRFALTALGAAVVVVLMTPVVWRVDWSTTAPVFAASYLSAATGSLFPLFPWAAYILFGAALGAWFVSWREAHPDADLARRLLAIGVVFFAAGVLLHRVPLHPYGAIEFWAVSPNLFLVKAGAVLVLLSAAARATRTLTALPRIVSVVSRESLTIYFVHVCILYGSIWNTGLLQAIGPHLDPIATGRWILLLSLSMALLASLWHRCKQGPSYLAVFIRGSVAVMLTYAIS